MKTTPKISQGMALLMTLTVVMVLSIALAQSFEDRSVEVKHLESNRGRFQAEVLARSVFRALLRGIKSEGLYAVHTAVNQFPKEFPIPIEEAEITEFQLRSLDHLFYLNRIFKAEDPSFSMDLLKEHLLQIKSRQKKETDLYGLEDQLNLAMSALNDWTDTDTDLDMNVPFGRGGEDYRDEYPTFTVKNRNFDFVSEVNLIPPFRELGISAQELEENFRVLKTSSPSVERIDINLASHEEIVQFLARYKELNTQYPTIYNRREDIATLAKSEHTDKFQPKYEGGDLEATGRESAWIKDLENEGIVLKGPELDLLRFRTSLLQIKYNLTISHVTIQIDSIIEIEYVNGGEFNKKNSIRSFTVRQFSMR